MVDELLSGVGADEDCVILVEAVVYQRDHFFFLNDTATTEIYPLSLHDALPISSRRRRSKKGFPTQTARGAICPAPPTSPSRLDRKSTRLNSSHQIISYAVFCLKKKNSKSHTRSHAHGHRQRYPLTPPGAPYAQP